MILPIIFILLMIAGIIWYKHDEWSCCAFALSIVSAALVLICIIIAICEFGPIDAIVAQNYMRYDSLVYQYENQVFDNDDDAVGKKELYNQIQEWNEDLAANQANQHNAWFGILIPDVYDQFEYIELTH